MTIRQQALLTVLAVRRMCQSYGKHESPQTLKLFVEHGESLTRFRWTRNRVEGEEEFFQCASEAARPVLEALILKLDELQGRMRRVV